MKTNEELRHDFKSKIAAITKSGELYDCDVLERTFNIPEYVIATVLRELPDYFVEVKPKHTAMTIISIFKRL